MVDTATAPQVLSKTGMDATSVRRTLVGVDVGGTKTQIAVVDGDINRNTVVPTPSWRRYSETVDAADMAALVRLVNNEVRESGAVSPASLCVGLHGADTPTQTADAQRIVSEGFNGPALVINDAELISHAGDADTSISMILGTGAIVVGRTATGKVVKADGYGWMLSDSGSAPSLARESVRAILEYAIDAGEDAAMRDPLGMLFSEALDAKTVTDISVAFTYRASETGWGDLAPLVFSALEQDSPLAKHVLEAIMARIIANINSVIARGAVGDVVIAAGGVITHQPGFANMLGQEMAVSCLKPMRLEILRNKPVRGALSLAGTL